MGKNHFMGKNLVIFCMPSFGTCFIQPLKKIILAYHWEIQQSSPLRSSRPPILHILDHSTICKSAHIVDGLKHGANIVGCNMSEYRRTT